MACGDQLRFLDNGLWGAIYHFSWSSGLPDAVPPLFRPQASLVLILSILRKDEMLGESRPNPEVYPWSIEWQRSRSLKTKEKLNGKILKVFFFVCLFLLEVLERPHKI